MKMILSASDIRDGYIKGNNKSDEIVLICRIFLQIMNNSNTNYSSN